MTNRRPVRFPFILAAALMWAVGLAGCSSSGSPTQPSGTGLAISNVTFNVSSIGVGGSAEGTVTLSAAPSLGPSTVTLASNNTAVVSVPGAVTIPVGSTTGTFTATALASGSATITASLNGSTRQSPALTVSQQSVALRSITLSAGSVVGGSLVTGTATLTAPAPGSGAVVALTSTGPIAVPSSVTIVAGDTSAPFAVQASPVGADTSATISGTFGGASSAVSLKVTHQTVAVANFGVTGETQTETCTLASGGAALNCTFDGSTSTAPGTITAWDWTWGVQKMKSETTSGPVFMKPSFDCSLIPAPPFPAGQTWFPMVVRLVVHDNQGNVSSEAAHNDVRLLPQGACGY